WLRSDLEADFFPALEEDRVGTIYEEHVSVRPGPPKIMPYAGFEGDPEDAFWLPDADLAFLFRGVAAWGRQLKLEFADYEYERHTTEAPVFSPGTRVRFTCQVDADFEWSRLELYRGATRIATVLHGEADDPSMVQFEHRVESSDRLAQGFVVLAYDPFGQLVQVSNPATLLALEDASGREGS
ncbi:MAG: hypothetical protein ACLFU2_12825, partial [Opitutales bacterium]